ncbi:unnamed protein product, partial [Rotaria sp. Silwood2]
NHTSSRATFISSLTLLKTVGLIKDVTRGLTFAQQLQAGSVWVNDYAAVCNQAPFGGFKQSGHGRELGRYGLEEYYEVKTVVVKLI